MSGSPGEVGDVTPGELLLSGTEGENGFRPGKVSSDTGPRIRHLGGVGDEGFGLRGKKLWLKARDLKRLRISDFTGLSGV